MSGNQARLQAIDALTEGVELFPAEQSLEFPADEMFGAKVFDLQKMKAYLPKAVFRSIQRTIELGDKLDASSADAVASAMKSWAMSHGATHYTHVFYPLTGRTAEKHDSFLVPDYKGGVLTEFSGAQLIQGEPDGSSFPNGGIRQTFEARGYTAWDITSPAYLLEHPQGSTLCIPTAFVSWTGEALDKKTPLLRSMQALNQQARRVLALFGDDDGSMVTATAGPEQEYFLVDKKFFYARPDLVSAGRTLFGAAPAKGQEFDDHYFGDINQRVLDFMLDCEQELLLLGIPVKTRHNEVAPGQYEIAPTFENANVATDHQQLLMSTLQRIADKHNFACLLHEKPFAGINGSGKHVNFSMGNSHVGNLLDPGENPHSNMRFLTFCTAVIRAVSRYATLLRAVVASSSNDHRLGANEAPPAIISIFLGNQLSDVYQQLKSGGEATSSIDSGTLTLGVDTLPPLPKHSGDRNRTSPFAFTGNRFEFRAVGSNQSVADPLSALNTIVAESLDFMAGRLEESVAGGAELKDAVSALIKEIYNEHSAVVFDGDGYTDDWHAHAVKERNLPNLRTTADALPAYLEAHNIAVFEKYGVMSRREVESHTEVYLEQYVKSLQVEAKLMLRIGRTQILPAATRYQSDVASNLLQLQELGLDADKTLLTQLVSHTNSLTAGLAKLESTLGEEADDLTKEARHLCDHLLPQMAMVREHADALETLVADDLWPLPTYQEMLFMR